MEINCDDLGDMGTQCPLSPVTPKTPKSLISQLSRDESGIPSRKRLSYSSSTERESVTVVSEDESDESENEEIEENTSAEPKTLNLLNIDVTSFLGQRVRKHVQVETPVQVLSDSENFCRTPVKNNFLEKLRKKPPSYPVMYKPRRISNLNKQNHLYKFSVRERKEFYEYLNTGLNKESRELLKNMKEMSVKLKRLERKALLRWIPRKVLNKQLKIQKSGIIKGVHSKKFNQEKFSYPQGPMLFSKKVDKILGLKKKSTIRESDRLRNPLSVGNYVSEEMEAELSKQKLTLYRSLLCEVQEYKAGAFSGVDKAGNTEEEVQNEDKEVRQLNKPGKSAKKVGYIPIADRVFEKDTVEKPKGEMSFLRTLLLENKEDTLNPEMAHKKGTTSKSLSVMKSPKIKQLSSSLEADLVHGFKLKKGTIESESGSSSCLSSPGSIRSFDGADVSPVTDHAGRKSIDTISIISMSSDGESPIVNCCAGCNNKIESSDGSSVPRIDEGLSKFLEPLTVSVDTEYDNAEYDGVTNGSSVVDTTYGIPSPVPSTSESPIPLSSVKTQKLIEPSTTLIQEVEEQSKKRVTRSHNSLYRVSGESPGIENKILLSDSRISGSFNDSLEKDIKLCDKTDSPKSSPRIDKKELVKVKTGQDLVKTVSTLKSNSEKADKQPVRKETGLVRPVRSATSRSEKVDKKTDGVKTIATKSSPKKDIKEILKSRTSVTKTISTPKSSLRKNDKESVETISNPKANLKKDNKDKVKIGKNVISPKSSPQKNKDNEILKTRSCINTTSTPKCDVKKDDLEFARVETDLVRRAGTPKSIAETEVEAASGLVKTVTSPKSSPKKGKEARNRDTGILTRNVNSAKPSMRKAEKNSASTEKSTPDTGVDFTVKAVGTPTSNSDEKDQEIAELENVPVQVAVSPKSSPMKDGNKNIPSVTPKNDKDYTSSKGEASGVLKVSFYKKQKNKESASKKVIENIPRVSPVKKSQSLTPSPSPKKADMNLKKSATITPDASPEKEIKIKSGSVDVKTSAAGKTGTESPKKNDTSPDKIVVQLRSSTLVTPTKMTIRTRSVSVEGSPGSSCGDDNQYSLRSGNFIINSPVRNSSMSELLNKNVANVDKFPLKDKMVLSESNKSPRRSNSVMNAVNKKIDLCVKTVSPVSSPSKRRKRVLSSPAQETRPAKLRKVSSDNIIKSK